MVITVTLWPINGPLSNSSKLDLCQICIIKDCLTLRLTACIAMLRLMSTVPTRHIMRPLRLQGCIAGVMVLRLAGCHSRDAGRLRLIHPPIGLTAVKASTKCGVRVSFWNAGLPPSALTPSQRCWHAGHKELGASCRPGS